MRGSNNKDSFRIVQNWKFLKLQVSAFREKLDLTHKWRPNGFFLAIQSGVYWVTEEGGRDIDFVPKEFI